MEIEYVRVLNPWGESFGGNQSSFGNQPKGRLIARCGCGLIAACDMTLFLMKTKVIPWVEYVKFVCDKSKYLSISDTLGIPPKKLIKMLSEFNSAYNFAFIPRHRLSESGLRELFKESLSKNLPVIVRAGENFKKLPYKMNGAERKMRWHYFTVTGIDGDKLTFCSWGRKGEMSLSDLYRFFGVTGGVIETKSKK